MNKFSSNYYKIIITSFRSANYCVCYIGSIARLESFHSGIKDTKLANAQVLMNWIDHACKEALLGL